MKNLHPLLNDRLRIPIEQVVSEYRGNKWTVKEFKDINEFSSHPGQPAILVYGRLAPNSAENPQAQRKWDKTLGLQLTWRIKDSIYTLETLGPYVTEQDLIRMTESMKPSSAP